MPRLIRSACLLLLSFAPLHRAFNLKVLPDAAPACCLYAEPTDAFCNLVADSLTNQTFVGFTLQGPKSTGDKLALRGRLRRVQGRPLALKKNGRCVQVTFKFHGATDVAKNYADENVVEDVVRPLLEGESVIDSEWGPAVEAATGTTVDSSLQGGRLETAAETWEYHAEFGRKHRLVSQKSKIRLTTKELLDHDRMKKRPLSPTDAVWPALGLASADGRPKPGKKAKLTQAQKFVEVVSRLIDQVSTNEEELRIYDMGCGRGYLTFSLHAHLIQNGSGTRRVDTRGIDVRPKLVKDMNVLSKSLDFDGLTFHQGTIEEYILAGEHGEEKEVHGSNVTKVWLALHACDTATDDALWSGIVQNAKIIVVAPCCHKELRPQLDRSMPEPDVLRHGIFRQRWAATLTDSIRVLLLELAGYQVQVLEFVQTADTPQNVMITAVKKRSSTDSSHSNEVRQRLQSLAQRHGVEHQALATWMGETLGTFENVQNSVEQGLGHGMPPV